MFEYAQVTKIVKTPDELPDFSAHNVLVIDTETSGFLRQTGARICGIAVGPLKEASAYYIPVRHEADNLALDAVMAWLRPLAADPARKWIFHNSKFDLKMFEQEQITFAGMVIDTMLMAYAINTSRFSYGLDSLTKIYLDKFEHTHYEKVREYILQTQKINIKGRSGLQPNYAKVPVAILGPYALEDINATRHLANRLNKVELLSAPFNYGMPAWSQAELMLNEFKCARVISKMEDRGILIDRKRCVELAARAEAATNESQYEMEQLAGFSFNPGGKADIEKAFTTVCGEIKYWNLPKEKRGKQKGQQFTENAEDSNGRANWNAVALMQYLKEFKEAGNEKAVHFIKHYKNWSLNSKINATYFQSFLRMMDFEHRLHGQFKQTGTVTGRLSSEKPNLQNQAKTGGTADQKAYEKLVGYKDEDAINRMVRTLFIAKPGHVLVSCDFSQIEYRTAVWYSQDQAMIEAWKADPRIDYHDFTMQLLRLDRDLCKTVNFGTLYGMLANGLAATLTAMGRPTTKNEAQVILNLLFEKRPALRSLINDVGDSARRLGYVQNKYGRVVDVMQEQAYKALNYLVQGHCGDMMREALVRVDALIQAQGWPVDILLTVHDEIVYEMPDDLVPVAAPALAEEMCRCGNMGVPILSDIEVGRRWSDQIPLAEFLQKGLPCLSC